MIPTYPIWWSLIQILSTCVDPDGLQISSSLPALTGWPTRSSRSKSLGSGCGWRGWKMGDGENPWGCQADCVPARAPNTAKGAVVMNSGWIQTYSSYSYHWKALWTMVKCAQIARKCTIGRQTAPTGAVSRSTRVNFQDLMEFKHHLRNVVGSCADLANYT